MLEFEGKELLRGAGVDVPGGHVLRESELAETALAFPVAVKAQVASGGRGKQGGVMRAGTARELQAAAATIFDLRFDDARPESVLVEQWLTRKREMYLALTVDGRADGFVLLYAPEGGVDIETGELPARHHFGSPHAFRGHKFRRVLAEVESDPSIVEQVIGLARRLLRLAIARDCTTIEINPLILTEDGSLIAADAKVVRDTAAAFRAPDIQKLIALEQGRASPAARRCLDTGLMLVELDGRIGLISGGAGMTMAVMDLIAAAGERPAAFLDCSANPTPTGYRLAFELLDNDPGVKAILVSIFGGATQMERVARVMTDILTERSSNKPVIFRLDGTNVAGATEIFRDARIENHNSIEAAVTRAVAAARAPH